MLALVIEKRNRLGKAAKRLAREGKLPAVFYGRKEASTPIALNAREFERVWKEAGESSVVGLKDADGTKEALIHDVDRDPVKGTLRHVDFYVFEKGQKVTVSVPLELSGVAPAAKELGGILVRVIRELEIEAPVTSIPHSIEIDISTLKDFESQILVQNIVLPEGVTTTLDPEEVVVSIAEAKEEEEMSEEAPDLSSIEVEEKGKKEEGEEDTAK